MGNVANWTGDSISTECIESYENELKDAESAGSNFVFPRIVEWDYYLDRLNQAVSDVVSKNADPSAELSRAAEDWKSKTESVGEGLQRSLIRKSEGL